MKYSYYEQRMSLTGVRLIKMVSPMGQVRLFDKRWFETMAGMLSEDEMWLEGVDPTTIQSELVDKDTLSVTDPKTGQTALINVTAEQRETAGGFSE